MKKVRQITITLLLMLLVCPFSLQAQSDNLSPIKRSSIDTRLTQNEKRAAASPVRTRQIGITNYTTATTSPFKRGGYSVNLAPRKEPSSNYVPTIYGIMTYDNTWTSSTAAYGIYSFPATATNFTETPEKLGDNFIADCGVVYDDTWHFISRKRMSQSYYSYTYYEYNATTFDQILSKTVYSSVYISTDFAYDPTTGKVYGAFPNDSYGADHQELGTIDFSGDISTNIIGSLGDVTIIALACRDNGYLYGISSDGDFYYIEKDNAKLHKIGNTGVPTTNYSQSMTFDPRTNTLYWSAIHADETTALYTIDIKTGQATKVLDFPNGQSFNGLYIPSAIAQDGAPAKADNLQAQFENGSLTGNVTFTVPTKTFSGNDLTGTVTYYIVANGDTLKSGTANAGANVTEQITVTGGETQIQVVTKNASGKSPAAKIVLWTGADTPVAVDSVNLDIDESGKATVKWDTPKKGIHQGYVNPDEVSYDVQRLPDSIAVSTGKTDTTFTEQLPTDQLKNYSYSVTPSYKGLKGEAKTSNKKAAGTAFEVPFFEDFSGDVPNLPFYTVLNLNNDDGKWYMTYQEAVGYEYDKNNAADDWLLTPPIHLKTDRSYIFSFKYKNSYLPERIAAAFGQGKDPSTYTELMPKTDVTSGEYETFTKEIRVTEDGDYYFGFHALSDANMSTLYVDDISVQIGTLNGAPDSVANFKVTPAQQGKLEATITFDAPTKISDKSSNLTSISKIEVLRDGASVGTINNPAVGAKGLKVTDNSPKNGTNTYTVVAYNDKGSGTKDSASAWIGLDQPLAPRNVKVVDHGTSVSLSWDAPESTTTGRHGGYVDPSKIRYSVYDASSYEAIVTEHINGLNCEDTKVNTLASGDRQNMLYYHVFSEISLGDTAYIEGGLAFSPYIRTGNPMSLPFAESIPAGSFANDGCWGEGYYKTTWGTTTSFSQDNDGGALVYHSSMSGDYATIHLPKFSLKGTTHPQLSFWYVNNPGIDQTIEAVVETNNYEPIALTSIPLKSARGNVEWRKAKVDLSDYINSDYVIPGIKGIDNDGQNYLIIDNIELRDVKDNDLSAEINVPKVANVNAEQTISVTVKNVGINDANDYNVSLFKGDNLYESKKGTAIKQDGSAVVEFKYTPAITDPSTLFFHAVVNLNGDGDLSNDTTVTAAMTIHQNSYPTAENVTASNSDDKVTISWTAPNVNQENAITDDFESYEPWITQGIGDWTTVDGDKGTPYNINSNYRFDGDTEPYAFKVFNPTNWKLSGSNQDMFAPHSGSQYLACFDAQPNPDEGITHNDDWLISPLLSGDEQEISFFAKSLSSDYKEKFSVLYSTQGKDTSDFKSVVKNVNATPANWTEYSAELPSGAKYFAIHVTSANCWALFIDDIYYEGVKLVITGYNIYEDGKLIGTVNADQTSFSQTNDGKVHKYQVGVVYNAGESALVDAYDATGINTIVSDKLPQIADVYTTNGQLVGKQIPLNSLHSGVYVVKGQTFVVK